MSFALEFDGDGYVTADTVGNILALDTFEVNTDYMLWASGTGYLWGQVSSFASVREFGLANVSGNLTLYVGGTSNNLGNFTTLFGTASPEGSLNALMDFTTNTFVLTYEGSPIYNGSVSVGTGRTDNILWRFGARANSGSPGDTTGAFFLGSGDRIGNTEIYANGVLVRNYVSDGSGSTWEEVENSFNGTLRSLPTTGQWVEYGGASTQSVIPSAINSSEAFGSPTIQNLLQILSPTGIVSQEAFGNATISSGSTIISPTAISSQEALGIPDVELLDSFIVAQGIPSEESFGDTEVVLLLKFIFPNGIVSQEKFGNLVVTGGDEIVIPILDRITFERCANYLKSLSFKGSVNDIILKWLRSEGYTGNFNDAFDSYLKDQNYQGAFSDKLANWKKN